LNAPGSGFNLRIQLFPPVFGNIRGIFDFFWCMGFVEFGHPAGTEIIGIFEDFLRIFGFFLKYYQVFTEFLKN
jgi:hypothetical protein